MIRRSLPIVALLLACQIVVFAQSDVKGAKDHPLVTRMPGYYIDQYETKEFDKYTSAYVDGAAGVWEGKITTLEYYIKEGATQASMIQIARNYQNAFTKAGGKTLYAQDRVFGGKIVKDGATCYVHVEAFNEGRQYSVVIVEAGTMKQDVKADAAALGASIASDGKVAVYGIYFDTGKSLLKPESAPTLEEIGKLLKQNPKLNLYVVGHTDNQGTPEANLKLSADRADAVVRALLGQGIKAARLKAAGVGQYCPVATNRTEDGRAKNRRVELVEQ